LSDEALAKSDAVRVGYDKTVVRGLAIVHALQLLNRLISNRPHENSLANDELGNAETSDMHEFDVPLARAGPVVHHTSDGVSQL
jgi:hypothetical protein